MVRYANTLDIPRIVQLARREHAKSVWVQDGFDDAHVSRLCGDFITTYGRTLLVSPGGYLAGMVQPLGFTARLAAMEFAWYAEDGSGMSLLERFESWAASMNAKSMVVHDYIGDGRLGKVLGRKRGYKHLGITLVKQLEN